MSFLQEGTNDFVFQLPYMSFLQEGTNDFVFQLPYMSFLQEGTDDRRVQMNNHVHTMGLTQKEFLTGGGYR